MVMVNMYVDTQEALVHSKANLYVSRMEHRRRCLSPSIFIFFFLFFFLLRSLLRCSVILSCWGDILSETWEMKFVLSFHVTTQIPACSFANWNMASEITTARGENCEIVSQNHSAPLPEIAHNAKPSSYGISANIAEQGCLSYLFYL